MRRAISARRSAPTGLRSNRSCAPPSSHSMIGISGSSASGLRWCMTRGRLQAHPAPFDIGAEQGIENPHVLDRILDAVGQGLAVEDGEREGFRFLGILVAGLDGLAPGGAAVQ